MTLVKKLDGYIQTGLERPHTLARDDVAHQQVQFIGQAVCKQIVRENMVAEDQWITPMPGLDLGNPLARTGAAHHFHFEFTQ